MTATQTRIRRGTEAQCNAMTPASSEVIHDTSNNRLRAGDGSRQGGFDIPNFSDIQKQAFISATVGGTANAITLTNPVPIIAYARPLKQVFKATGTNTTAVTVDVDGKGVKEIRKRKSGSIVALEAGDIINGGEYEITYDGTYFQISGLDESEGSTASVDLLIVATGGGASYDFTHDIGSNHLAYLFVLDSVLPATDGVFFQMRTRRTGQGSFDSGAGNYASGYNEVIRGVGTTNTVGGAVSATNIALSGLVQSAMTGLSGQVLAPGLPLNKYNMFRYSLGHRRAGEIITIDGCGLYLNTLALNGVQFFFSSGNIASGSIYMYGLRTAL